MKEQKKQSLLLKVSWIAAQSEIPGPAVAGYLAATSVVGQSYYFFFLLLCGTPDLSSVCTSKLQFSMFAWQ